MLRLRPEMAVDGIKVGDKVKGKVLHARYSRYMQQVAEVDPALVAALARSAPASPTTAASRRPAPSRCRWPTTPATASSRASPTTIQPQRHPCRQEEQGEGGCLLLRAAGLPGAGQPGRHALCRSDPAAQLPDYFITADDIPAAARGHPGRRAALDRFLISKTANVPTDFPFEQFKDIYHVCLDSGAEGLHHLPLQPRGLPGRAGEGEGSGEHQYEFTLEDGSVIDGEGNEEIEYDGELHTAANLYDALKEGYYGKF
jgi:ribonucleoside-diphosphate reductase alpha chain